jgi:hypothetical protein
MPLMQFQNADARVVYLATVYHLGRPGSEAAAAGGQRHDLGLQAVHDELLPRLDQAVVEVEMSPYQVVRLGTALLGVSNELKQFGIANGRSSVPRFEETMAFLFPETVEDPGVAMDLAGQPVALRRRIDLAVTQAESEIAEQQAAAEEQHRADRGRWWQVWRRGGDRSADRGGDQGRDQGGDE